MKTYKIFVTKYLTTGPRFPSKILFERGGSPKMKLLITCSEKFRNGLSVLWPARKRQLVRYECGVECFNINIVMNVVHTSKMGIIWVLDHLNISKISVLIVHFAQMFYCIQPL